MRRVLVLLALAVMLGSPLETLTASRDSNSEMHQLKKRHKEQNKALKQQQRAMKKVMDQHELSSDVTERFNHDLKMQRQLLRKDQKDETHNLKKRNSSDAEARKATRPGNPTAPIGVVDPER
jgi:hypothetical protein